MTSVADYRCRWRKTGPGASFFVGIGLLCWALLLAGCGEPGPAAMSYSGPIMGTSYHVKVVVPPGQTDNDLDDAILAVLEDIDRKMSTYKAESELNQLNAAPVGQAVSVSPALLEVLLLSRKVYLDTGGAFDPTVGPLVDLWGFGPTIHAGNQVPDGDRIAALLEEVGFDGLAIDANNGRVTKRRPLALDLSAVAKGYAADQVVELLRARGISRYMVEVGGELAVAGLNDRGTPWQIAIEKPDVASRTVQIVASVSDGGVATSGDYRNYFEEGGVRYSHTLDPRTGHPIRHPLASVTVIAENSGLADALATAFMVMGTEATLAYAERHQLPVFTLSKVADGFEAAHSQAFAPYIVETP